MKAQKYKLLKSEKEMFMRNTESLINEHGFNRIKAEDKAYSAIKRWRNVVKHEVYRSLMHNCRLDDRSYDYLVEEHGINCLTAHRFGIVSVTKNAMNFLCDEFNMDDLKVAGLIKSSKKDFVFGGHAILFIYEEKDFYRYVRGLNIDQNFNSHEVSYIYPYSFEGHRAPEIFYNYENFMANDSIQTVFITEGEIRTMRAEQEDYPVLGITNAYEFPMNKIELLQGKNITFECKEDEIDCVKAIASEFNDSTEISVLTNKDEHICIQERQEV